MVAHLWQLRADPAPLEAAARQWARVSAALTATADDIVDAARHALDQGWESEAAESYEARRRQVVQHLDTFTSVAASIGGSLAALAAMLRIAQDELDRAWALVAAVPHELVGEDRVLVLHPASDGDEELLRGATATARAVRERLDLQLDAESTRLQEARTELSLARSALVQAAGGTWPTGADLPGTLGDGVPGSTGSPTGVDVWGVRPGGGGSTSVLGGAAGGGSVPGAPSLPAVSVSIPALSGSPGLSALSATALAAGAGLAGGLGGGLASRRRDRREQPAPGTGPTPMGGMAAGAAMRGGSGGRAGGGSGSRSVPARPSAPSRPSAPARPSAEEAAARLAREKEQGREDKRRLVAQRRAERAARRAERERAAAEERRGAEVSAVPPGDGPAAQR